VFPGQYSKFSLSNFEKIINQQVQIYKNIFVITSIGDWSRMFSEMRSSGITRAVLDCRNVPDREATYLHVFTINSLLSFSFIIRGRFVQ